MPVNRSLGGSPPCTVPAERVGAATLLLTAAGYGGLAEVAWLVEPSQVVGGPRGGDRREEVEVGEDGKDGRAPWEQTEGPRRGALPNPSRRRGLGNGGGWGGGGGWGQGDGGGVRAV